MSKKYVILNAALNKDVWQDVALRFLYKSASLFGNNKYRSAKIIDICKKPDAEQLSVEDLQAICSADKIIIMGHCYDNALLYDTYKKCSVTPDYIAEFLANAFNRREYKATHVSLIACESLIFGANLIACFGVYPNLCHLIVSARKFDVQLDPWTGSKNNLINGTQVAHHQQTDAIYKLRFSIDRDNSDIITEEVAGTLTPITRTLIPTSS